MREFVGRVAPLFQTQFQTQQAPHVVFPESDVGTVDGCHNDGKVEKVEKVEKWKSGKGGKRWKRWKIGIR